MMQKKMGNLHGLCAPERKYLIFFSRSQWAIYYLLHFHRHYIQNLVKRENFSRESNGSVIMKKVRSKLAARKEIIFLNLNAHAQVGYKRINY